jgi:hypothetical protein
MVIPTGAYATGFSDWPIPQDISCPSPSLCMAVDDKGYAVISTDPASPVSTWVANTIPGMTPQWLTAVACPSEALCVVGDLVGRVAVTTNPTDASPTWHVHTVEYGGWIRDISCPSTEMCVAVTGGWYNGYASVLRSKVGAEPVWTAPVHIDDTQVDGVSCPSATLCVAIDKLGRVLISTDPGAAAPHWSSPRTVDPSGLLSISCASESLCVAIDTGGSVRSIEPGNPSAAWSVREPTGVYISSAGTQPGNIDISCPTVSLCLDVGTSVAISTAQQSATPSWSPAPFAGSFGGRSVSCASESFCVVLGGGAQVSTAPASPTPGWTAHQIDGLPHAVATIAGAPVVRGRSVTVPLGCESQDEIEECAANARLTATVTRRIGRRRVSHTVLLAHTSFVKQQGFSGQRFVSPVTLILNGAGRRLLARAGRVHARLEVDAYTAERRFPAPLVPIGVFHVSLGHGRHRA